jgi:FKBP-type peptidyl-prolyl cis-trans isomerase (trigger factor)
MKTDVKKIDKLKRVLRIAVSKEILERDKKTVYKKISKDLKIPGFRPGAAPLEVAEKLCRAEFREEFLKRIIPSYYAQALQDNKLEPVATPRIYDVDFGEENLVFSAEFEVKPQIDLKESDYKNLNVKYKAVKIEEIEIEKLITQLKENVKKIIKKDYSDEDLTKWAGYPSVVAFKEAMRAEVTVNKLRTKRAEIENTLTEELIKRIDIDVPRVLIEEQHRKLVEQEVYNLRLRGIDDKDINKYEDEIKKKVKPVAEKQVKLYYILEAVARKESLEVDSRNLFDAVMGYILSCARYSNA